MARPDGAPFAKGELDPELVRLRKPLPKLGALASLAGALVCAVMLWRMGSDMRFASATLSQEFVAGAYTEAPLDVSVGRAVRIRRGVGAVGRLLLPVNGSGDTRWISVAGGGWDDPSALLPALGRVRPVAETQYANTLPNYVAAQSWPAFVRLADVRAGRLVATTGEAVTPAANAMATIDVVVPHRARIRATFGTRLPDAKAWGIALAAAGLYRDGVPTATDVDKYRAIFEFVSGTEASAVAQAEAALRDAELWGALVEPISETIEVPWQTLVAGEPVTTTTGGAPRTIPDGAIMLVSVPTVRRVPGNALVLVVGEQPAQFANARLVWFALWPLLALFALGIRRGLRAWR